jgi:hypothetical protein
MKTINKQQKLFAEKCAVCKKEITGHTEPMVKYRMEMHMRTHEQRRKGE